MATDFKLRRICSALAGRNWCHTRTRANREPGKGTAGSRTLQYVPRFEESVGCLWPDVHAPHAALCSVHLKGPEVEIGQTTLDIGKKAWGKDAGREQGG